MFGLLLRGNKGIAKVYNVRSTQTLSVLIMYDPNGAKGT